MMLPSVISMNQAVPSPPQPLPPSSSSLSHMADETVILALSVLLDVNIPMEEAVSLYAHG